VRIPNKCVQIFRRSSNRLINREKLISVGNLEEVTFKNCAGFIRINVKDLENGRYSLLVDLISEYKKKFKVLP
jgi:transcriptional accessory protein Tex/SPT6